LHYASMYPEALIGQGFILVVVGSPASRLFIVAQVLDPPTSGVAIG